MNITPERIRSSYDGRVDRGMKALVVEEAAANSGGLRGQERTGDTGRSEPVGKSGRRNRQTPRNRKHGFSGFTFMILSNSDEF